MAVFFALVAGANDGGALLATGLKLSTPKVGVALVALTAAVVAIPFLTDSVAHTFTNRLVGFDSQLPVLAGVTSALAVVLVLTAIGRPTSLTLATVGGLTGAGLGSGGTVAWDWVLYVLAVGLAAPFVGAILAFFVSKWLRTRNLVRVHLVGFFAQCIAYAANDGQKILAVFLLAVGSRWWTPLVIGSAFALGALYGLPRTGLQLGGRLLAVRPADAVAAEVASAGAVLGSSALGVPVSMTQSVAGALIGAGRRRIRWPIALRLVFAWLLTLPGSVVLAALLTWTIT